ncbi:MAG: polynucleotide adenylyltransferase PcnB [Chlamydiota bacterium]
MTPKIYPKEEHGIELDAIDPKALYILEKLRYANYTAYLVGGGVRDLLLKKTPKDFDIATSAKPEEIKATFPNAILIGKRFRLAHVRFGRKVIEVSTFRAGNIENEDLIVEDNVWGSPEEDAIRRDFTINGLFYESAKQVIIDYVGGYTDIQKKYLRAIGQPYLRFKQDPVRMIRCLKFQARYGFEVDEKARFALIDCKSEITKSAQARVLEELLRMLESGSAYSFFKLMIDHGLLQQLLSALTEFVEHPAGNEIYAYLREVDSSIKEPHSTELKRPVLMTCLIFPLLENRLKVRYSDREKKPHLGQIYEEVQDLINDIFNPFFQLPRRMRIMIIELIVAQYRITPFAKRKTRKIYIPKSPSFFLAMQFLQLRCRLEPGLKETAEKWQAAYKKSSPPKYLSQPKRTRKRRRPR